MKLFKKAPDGGEGSGVTGLFIIEIKPLFSIVLLHFNEGTREAYHSHAFSAFTIWLRGHVTEHLLTHQTKTYKTGSLKWTHRSTFHKVDAQRETWALSFRGPWRDRWHEKRDGGFVALTHGREVLL